MKNYFCGDGAGMEKLHAGMGREWKNFMQGWGGNGNVHAGTRQEWNENKSFCGNGDGMEKHLRGWGGDGNFSCNAGREWNHFLSPLSHSTSSHDDLDLEVDGDG